MSFDLETRLKTVLASAPRNVHPIQSLEIRHSAMSKTYYLWPEYHEGTITTEAGEVPVDLINFDVKPASDEGDLDQKFQIRLDTVGPPGTDTDIEDEFREQMDRVPVGTQEKIVCIYRVYLSDDLTEAMARYVLQVEEISYQIGAAGIVAVAPRLNKLRCGELYTMRDVPMLRAYL